MARSRSRNAATETSGVESAFERSGGITRERVGSVRPLPKPHIHGIMQALHPYNHQGPTSLTGPPIGEPVESLPETSPQAHPDREPGRADES